MRELTDVHESRGVREPRVTCHSYFLELPITPTENWSDGIGHMRDAHNHA